MTLKIAFPLSFYIPVFSDTTTVSSFVDFAIFKFRFVDNELKKGITSTTILMEYTPLMDTSEYDIKTHFHNGVLNSIIFLNNFIDAYRLTNNMEFIKNFTITDLPPIIEIAHEENISIYITQPRLLRYEESELTREMIGLAIGKTAHWRTFQPFEVIDKFLSKAIHHLYTEDFISAIIELQTSFESYIRLQQHIILNKSNKREEDIANAMDINVRNTIEHHLSKALNTDLNFKKNPIMNRWYNSLYKLRNGIVHSGNSYISGNTAYEAYDSYQATVNYISDLMVKNKFMPQDKMIYIGDLNKNLPDENNEEFIESLRKKGFLKFIENPET